MDKALSSVVILVATSLAFVTLAAAIAFSDFLLPYLLSYSSNPNFRIYISFVPALIGVILGLAALNRRGKSNVAP